MMLMLALSCSFCLSWSGRRNAALGLVHLGRTQKRQSKASPFCINMMSQSSTPTDKKKYPPSQTVVDPVDGTKWRKTAASAVFNSKYELLIGERIGKRDSWQCPQGGVDDAFEENGFQAETVAEAAARELYEEMGLDFDKDVVSIESSSLTDAVPPIRYDTSGTESWLTKNGFQGQELHWSVFRCVSALGDSDPSSICDLSGKGGEAPEFARVQWKPIDWVVENIWPAKRDAYVALQKALPAIKEEWEDRCNQLDFTGTWSRDATLSKNMVQSLVARGIEESKAKIQADSPYIQSFSRAEHSGSNTVWKVDTYNGDDLKTIRRSLDYKVGPFQESFSGQAFLFRQEAGGVLERRTSYVAEPESDSLVAHVVVTQVPGNKGDLEESRRFIKDGRLILQRTYWRSTSSTSNDGEQSREVFLRLDDA